MADLQEIPETRAVPFGVRGGVTVELPGPDRLAELLAEPRCRVPYTPPLGGRWMQPALFEAVA